MPSFARPWFAVVFLALGCDDPPRVVPQADASAVPPPAPPPREGCTRAGTLDGIESDPSCVVKHVNDEAMRGAMKSLSITIAAQPTEVVAGSTSLLEIMIKNTGPAETTLFFEARPRPSGARTDWSRVVGIPEPPATVAEVARPLFTMTTTDSYDRDVDAVPTIAGSVVHAPPPTVLAVHLRPGAKLVKSISWWALRIPAPAPIVKDDAGHRYVPKTAAINLYPGEYTVTVELPFYGLGREERKVSTRLRVTRVPLPDGGLRRSPF
jgi:hypothetical protein